MNVDQANALLDKVRDDGIYPAHIVDMALYLTGDLEEHQFRSMAAGMRSAGMDSTPQSQERGSWLAWCAGMVAECVPGHRKNSGQSSPGAIEGGNE